MPLPDPTTRFTDRVRDYVRYRPGYPAEVIAALREEAGLGAGRRVADVGAGTGIFTALLLQAGAEVYAVEPNTAMLAEAEAELGNQSRFHPIAAAAEETSLPDASVDLVTAAQAFHWFDAERARREFSRILRPEGQVALVWNRRRDDSTRFLIAYEALLHRFATDYERVDHRNISPDRLRAFFTGGFSRNSWPYVQRLDWEGLRGRLLSSSYVPAQGHPRHETMLAELRRLFDAHALEEHVEIEYDTELYLGAVRADARTAEG